MFDKEAEEYSRDFDWTNNDVAIDYSKRAFKDGAEFGYNKANEWHYVKNSDLPKETDKLMSETLQLITKMKGTDNLNLALGQFNFASQEFSYSHIMGLTDVIAWKEIVLPKLINDKED